MRLAVGVSARAIWFVAMVAVYVDALVVLAKRPNWGLFFGALIAFPITILVWPWKHTAFGVPLWIVGVVMLVAYPISTFVGGLDPVE